MKYLIFDISNILHRTYYANKDEDTGTISELAQHQALLTLNKYYNMHKPDKIVAVFDRKSWRKDYTKSDKAVSKKIYKAKVKTRKDEEKFKDFIKNVSIFTTILRDYTTTICLEQDMLEADDLIAGFIQKYADGVNEFVLISSDNDFIQLLQYDNTTIITPINDKERSLEEWDNDAELFLFEKCIRGDSADNVQSAYPNVRKTKIRKAWANDIDRVNLMESTWIDHEEHEFTVKDLFKENQLLIDLSKQPQNIRELMDETINEEMDREKKYDFFKLLLFLGNSNLHAITENIEKYAKMLSL